MPIIARALRLRSNYAGVCIKPRPGFVKAAWSATASHSPISTWPSRPKCVFRALVSQQRKSSNDLVASFLSHVPGPLVPPVILVGLAIALWTLKCINLVVFQNKIIYMPYMPPFARSEKIETYRAESGAVEWQEKRIASVDGTRLALCIGQMINNSQTPTQKKVLVLYFQGNGASSPMRIPMLSRSLQDIASATNSNVIVAALSYRGYWTSRGRPCQKGIELDAQAFLEWGVTHHADARLVVWGQSLGAGIALRAIAQAYQTDQLQEKLCGIILETPFVSVRRMLVALYPQKWLPYRHLWPFLRSSWDSQQALQDITACTPSLPEVLLLPAANDEVVPPEEVNHLQAICQALGVHHRREDILQAFHNDASSKGQGRRCIARFVSSCVQA